MLLELVIYLLHCLTTTKCIIPQLYYVPSRVKNLLSVSQNTKIGVQLTYSQNQFIMTISTLDGQSSTIHCNQIANLYPLGLTPLAATNTHTLQTRKQPSP